MSFPDSASTRRETDSVRDDATTVFRTALEEKSVWAGLCDGIHDAFFPSKLPPLELTSVPVPVPDRLRVNTSRWAVGTSTIVNGAVLALLVLISMRVAAPPGIPADRPNRIKLGDIPIFAPRLSAGSSGGGANEILD